MAMDDSDIVNSTASNEKPLRRIDWGNAPQWLSAGCAFILASLAIWGLFFSKTSQALVSYLQSELTIRNQRISAIELRERELQLSISAAQQDLAALVGKRAELETQVSQLRIEQENLSKKVGELGSMLSTAEFFLVREKVNSEIGSRLSELAVLRITLSDDLFAAQGVRPRTIKPWDSFVGRIKSIADKLAGSRGGLGKL
jgi:hypothetical protein